MFRSCISAAIVLVVYGKSQKYFPPRNTWLRNIHAKNYMRKIKSYLRHPYQISNHQPNHCSWNNGITQEEEKWKSSNIVFFYENQPSNGAWIFMCTTTNCENGFVSETKSHAHVREKSTLSGGGLDPSLLRWLPPVVVKDAKKAGVKETVWLQCCLPLWQT